MQMRRPLRLAAGLALGAAGVLPVALASTAQAAPGDPLEVNIFHVNDSHSHLDPSVARVNLGTSGGAFTYELGGWPRVQTMMEQLETAHAGGNNVKIHAGDALVGTMYYSLFGGEAEAAMMNHTCFDVFELGNHEFDDGDTALASFLDFLNSDDASGCAEDVLAANVAPAPGTPLNPDADPAVASDDYLLPYTLRDFGTTPADPTDEPEFMVGFVGIDIADKTVNSSSPDDTTEFLDEVATAQQYIDELTADGIQNIVLVTHQGFERDQALAAQLTGVDAIVGGDSHSLLGDSGAFGAFATTTNGDYPTLVTNQDGDPVCIAQAWQYSALVGELSLTFQNGTLTPTGCDGTPHMLVGDFTRDGEPIADPELSAIRQIVTDLPGVDEVTEDPEAVAALAPFKTQVDELSAEVVGNAVEPMCLNRIPGDTRSGSICTIDQIAESGARADVNGGFIQQVVTEAFLATAPDGTDLAIQNAGGVRVALTQGEITMGEVYELLPFENTMVTADLTGAEVVATLNEAINNVVNSDSATGAFPYGAGIRWDLDLTKPAGERFSNIEVRAADGTWAPLDPEATYTVVTNDFVAQGGDAYATFKTAFDDGRFAATGLGYREALLAWFADINPETADDVPDVRVPAPDDFSTQSFVPEGGELMAPVNPTRVLDTRPKTSPTVGTTFDGIGEGGGAIAPQTVREVQIAGRSVVPPTATAISINVTATDAAGEGYFTIWPCATTKPVASSVNYDAGQNIANSVVVPLSADGKVCISTGVSSAHAIVDVTGWSASSPDYTELGPSRLLDTRPETSPTSGVTVDGLHRGQGLLEPGERLVLPVTGRANVPAGTVAVTLNLTATGAVGPGYLTAYPCDVTRPLASTLNYADPRAIANSIVVPLAADGTLCIESGVAAVHVVADVTGAYAETDEFGGLTPARLIDTRSKTSASVGTTVDGLQEGNGPLAAGEVVEIDVTGRGGDGNEVPADARLVALNLTATEGAGPGYFTAWPCDQDRPVASSVNYLGPISVANSIIVDLSAEGTVCVFAGVNSAHVVADVTAYYK